MSPLADGSLWSLRAWLLGAIEVGRTLGQAHWADRPRLVNSVTQIAYGLSRHGAVAVGIAAVAALLAAASLGLLARGLGQLLQRAWPGNWPRWAGWASRRLQARRLQRWNAAQDQYAAAVLRSHDGRPVNDANSAGLEDLAARRNAIALAPPQQMSGTAADVEVSLGRGIYRDGEGHGRAGDLLAEGSGMRARSPSGAHPLQTYNDLSLLLFWTSAPGAAWGDAAGDGFDTS